jgi:hypothetical protein
VTLETLEGLRPKAGARETGESGLCAWVPFRRQAGLTNRWILSLTGLVNIVKCKGERPGIEIWDLLLREGISFQISLARLPRSTLSVLDQNHSNV